MTAKERVIERGVLHFSLGEDFGQLITNIAREKAWNDLKEGDAIVMLIEGLDCDPNQAREVIHGKKKFVTNDDHKTVRIVDDNWSPPDFEAIKTEIYKAVQTAKDYIRPGKLLLGERDILNIEVEIEDINKFIKLDIWEARNRAKALERFVLDIHNENREKMRDTFKDAHAKPLGFAEGDIMAQLKADSKARIEEMPLDPEMKARMLRFADGMDTDVDIRADPKFKSDTGWLDREGHYWACELGKHIPLAEQLVERFFPTFDGNAEKRLENEGWMKCTGCQWYSGDVNPNAAQQTAFKKWVKKWGERYSYNGTKYHNKALPVFRGDDD